MDPGATAANKRISDSALDTIVVITSAEESLSINSNLKIVQVTIYFV